MDVNQIAAINLRRSQLAVISTTTDAGAGAGDSFIDTTLIGVGAGSFVSMLAILYPGQPASVDSMAITAFDNVTGEVTLAGAYKGVAAPIPAGVPYMIVTFRFVAADVAVLTASVGDASASALGSLYAILGNPPVAIEHSIGHIPKYTGKIWFVDGTNGNDANTGTDPHDAFKTIAHAIGAAAAGDRIVVMAGAYDEVLNMNLAGLELICEQGTVLSNSTPGTALIVSANYCRVVGLLLTQAGQTGCQITGSFCSLEGCLAFGCATGFDDDGAETHFTDCRSILHTTTGFDISAGYGQYERLVAASTGAVRGIYLSNAAADHNHFNKCDTLGNGTAGWEIIVGADNNLFSHCSMGAGDGAKVDAGANNTWNNFSEGSQIVAGQTRDQDLKDIYDGVAASQRYREQIPDTDFDLTAITEDLASDPPGAPAANSVVDIGVNAGDTFVLRSLFVKINSFGTGGNKLTFKLWTLLNTAVTMVDEVDVTSLGIQNLADIFGLQEVHGDGIWITVQSDATPGSDDADCEGTYKWAKAT